MGEGLIQLTRRVRRRLLFYRHASQEPSKESDARVCAWDMVVCVNSTRFESHLVRLG